jgi:hypothetical protein
MKNRLKQRDISINSTGSLSYTGFDELTTCLFHGLHRYMLLVLKLMLTRHTRHSMETCLNCIVRDVL